MRVAIFHVTSTFVAGGSESYTWRLARHLHDQGIECELWGGSVSEPRIGDPSVRLRTGRFTPRERFSPLDLRLRKLCERLTFGWHARHEVANSQYDVVMIHKPYDIPTALWLRKTSGCRIVWRCHGEEFLPWMGKLAARLDAIYCVSDWTRQRLVKRWPVEASVIHTGVDSNYFDPSATAAKSASDRPKLIYFGRIVDWKGLKYLVTALEELRDRPWHATIVGDGPQRSELESMVAATRLGDRITFLATQPRDQIRTVVGESDIAVFPSVDHETFSNALLEAMSMARAVIATRVGGFPEAVTHGFDGILVNPRDSGDLAEAISDLLDDSDKRAVLGRRARETVQARFDARASFDRVERLLGKVVNGPARGPGAVPDDSQRLSG